MENNTNCECESCKNNLPFTLPEEIIEATVTGNLVIFAGAGISTETKSIFKKTLYEDVLTDLENPPQEELDFPSLMTRYCNSNINGRQKLLHKIKSRFDYCHQFIELYNQASQFHQELSSIYYIKEIVTTNWDDYFERECAAIPIVIPEDFAFHKLPDRKVYKIHGSISNYGTIVATKEDYDKCYRDLNRGIIGSYLKTILATKTVVFIGYSFRDYDFIKIYSLLKKELKSILPHCYLVTIEAKKPKDFKGSNITLINSDGAFFISILRKHLEGTKLLIPKENLDNVIVLRDLLIKYHHQTTNKILKKKQPNLVFCAFYQDGIKHAFDFLIFHSYSGKTYYPESIISSIESYENNLRKRISKAGNYADLAYIDGYIIGLHSIFIGDKLGEFPFWFIYGKGPIEDKKTFDNCIKNNIVYHKSAEEYGQRFFKKVLRRNSELVYHHRPFI